MSREDQDDKATKKEFGDIYDKYIKSIYRFVIIKIHSVQAAEDISSETFIRGWKVFQRKKGRIRNVRAFLYRIARNLVIDFYRREGKSKILSVEGDSIPLVDPKRQPDETALIKSDIDDIEQSLFNLRDDYQNVIIWHYLDEMSVPEIAKLLHRREGTVRVLLSRALKALKSQLSK